MAESTKKSAPTAKKSTTTNKSSVASTAKKTTSRAKATRPEISAHELQHMIATNAYFRAERRGFSHGNHEQDWMEAEAEITAKLKQKK